MAGSFLRKSRHKTIYHFRRRIPNDLCTLFGKTHLYRSLATESRSVAVRLARVVAAETDALFDRLRSMADDNDPKQAERLSALISDWKHKRALETQKEAHEVEIDHLKRQHHQELEELRAKAKEIALKAFVRGSAKAAPATAPTEIGILFPEAVESYLDLQRKGTTRKTYEGRLDHAHAFFGSEIDIRHIEQADLARYATHAKTTIPHPATAGHYITTLAGLLNHFRLTLGWGSTLTTTRLIEKKDTPDSEDRDAFSIDQLTAIFANAVQYRIKAPHKYWATLAVPFLGCRIEELAQIDLSSDLAKTTAGTWFLNLNARPDSDGATRKSLKNKSSWRLVPIHSALVKHGFVEYLTQQREKGFSRPFEEGWQPLTFDNGSLKWSHYCTNWGGRELKKITAKRALAAPEGRLSYFHSMRHSFSSIMRRAEISTEISEALLGHAYASAERERYAKLKRDPDQLSEKGIEPGLNAIARLLA